MTTPTQSKPKTYGDLTEQQLYLLLTSYDLAVNGVGADLSKYDSWTLEDLQGNFELAEPVSADDLETLRRDESSDAASGVAS